MTPLGALSILLLVAAGREGAAWLRQASATQALSGPPPSLRPDVNRAPERLLRLLPRIGPARARAIVARRQRNGLFAAVEDLVSVHGIGPDTVGRLLPWARATGGAP